MPGETKTFINECDISAGEDFSVYTNIIPAEKTLTRSVTKYRDEVRYKTVTKYRTENQCSV